MTASFLPRPVLWLSTLGVVLALNLGFLVFGILAASLPREMLEERVREAFASGELIEEDWRFHDRWRGHNQYNDCLILQMALNRDQSTLREVAGPNLYLRGWRDSCRVLSEIVHDPQARQRLEHERYTRYWHGYVPTASILLRVLPLGDLRSALKATVYGSLLLLLIATATDRRLLGLGTSVAFAGFAFWGLPYFGQSLSHAFGDALVILGPAALVFFRRRLLRPEALLPFAALLGGLLAYFEFLTGPIPTGAALLFVSTYLSARRRAGIGDDVVAAWRLGLLALVAFGIGSIATVALKQVLALMVLGADGPKFFLQHLYQYSGADVVEPLGYRLRVLRDLIASGWMLTEGSRTWLLLYGASGAAWVIAFGVGVWHRGPALADLWAFVLGAGIIAAWVFLLPGHTAAHVGFMNRILFVPVALGFAAFAWQMTPTPSTATR